MMTAREHRAALEAARDGLGKEHAALNGLLETIRCGATPGAEARGLLSELHKALAKHFAHETYAGGFYDVIREAMAELAPDLRLLEDEHIELLAITQALREQHARDLLPLPPTARGRAAPHGAARARRAEGRAPPPGVSGG